MDLLLVDHIEAVVISEDVERRTAEPAQPLQNMRRVLKHESMSPTIQECCARVQEGSAA